MAFLALRRADPSGVGWPAAVFSEAQRGEREQLPKGGGLERATLRPLPKGA